MKKSNRQIFDSLKNFRNEFQVFAFLAISACGSNKKPAQKRSQNADAVGIPTKGPSEGSPAPVASNKVPMNAAVSVAFTDTDLYGGSLAGNVSIGKASDESDVTAYALYWGSSDTVKINGPLVIATVNKTGANLTYSLAAGTLKPARATHLLVRTKNASGEMATGVSALIDDNGVPVRAATSLAFTDTDSTGGFLAGNISITKASDESNITDYVIYWGSNANVKLANQTPIATLAKTGANPSYALAINTAIPAGATHLLVRTKNADGEMATGVSLLIDDVGVPVQAAASVTFTDTNTAANLLGGVVTIGKATNESDITQYRIYWGSNATTKLGNLPAFAALFKTGLNLTYSFPANTARPVGATHLLVRTKNDDGEKATGVSVSILDLGVPVQAAASVTFTDTNTAANFLGGVVNIAKATNEANITQYLIYWGSNATTKLAGNQTAFATLNKTGLNLTYSFAANTAKPAGATHLLVRTKNADGEMASGVSRLIDDVGVPVQAAAGATFTDTNSAANVLGGVVNIAKAINESDITQNLIYWGSNATTKLVGNQTAFATLNKTGLNLIYTFPANTAKPVGANYLLVRTKNDDGEKATGVSLMIDDVGGVPVHAPASVAFTDSNPAVNLLGGVVTIGKAPNEANITQYLIYWGSDATTKRNPTI